MDLSIERVSFLPLRLRMAWGAHVVERVLQLYSTHFRATYHQDDALSYAWDFASGIALADSYRVDLINQIRAVAGDAEDEGYGFQEIGMGVELLEEIANADGKCAFVAVEDAAASYAYQCLYKAGMTSGEVSVECVDSLQQPVWALACYTLEFIEKSRPKGIARNMFDEISCDLKCQKLDASRLRLSDRRSPGPPVHEVLGK